MFGRFVFGASFLLCFALVSLKLKRRLLSHAAHTVHAYHCHGSNANILLERFLLINEHVIQIRGVTTVNLTLPLQVIMLNQHFIEMCEQICACGR